MSVVLKMLAGLAVAGMLGVATAIWHPRSPYPEAATEPIGAGEVRETETDMELPEMGSDEMTLEDVLAHEGEVVWIDARHDRAFREGHIPGAQLLNWSGWDEQIGPLIASLPTGDGVRIMVYCSSAYCESSHEIASRLRQATGRSDIYVLYDGWRAWQARGEP